MTWHPITAFTAGVLTWWAIDRIVRFLPSVRRRRAHKARPDLTGDGYHTMDELYEYRMLYHAHAANLWARHGTYFVAKSWRHHDGEKCFGGGWFIVTAHVKDGQVSNHYPADAWDLFQVPEMIKAPEWDGHTPAEAAQRLRAALSTEGN